MRQEQGRLLFLAMSAVTANDWSKSIERDLNLIRAALDHLRLELTLGNRGGAEATVSQIEQRLVSIEKAANELSALTGRE